MSIDSAERILSHKSLIIQRKGQIIIPIYLSTIFRRKKYFPSEGERENYKNS
jgi:hypothetical protein